MVVPASTRIAPLRAMTSGMRKEPPISTNSPRDTITSRSLARVSRDMSTAAALLFTTRAAWAPVNSQSSSSTWLYLGPAPAFVQIVFQVAVISAGDADGFQGLFRDEGPP